MENGPTGSPSPGQPGSPRLRWPAGSPSLEEPQVPPACDPKLKIQDRIQDRRTTTIQTPNYYTGTQLQIQSSEYKSKTQNISSKIRIYVQSLEYKFKTQIISSKLRL